MDYRQGVPVPQATITHMTIEAQLTELRAMREDAAAEAEAVRAEREKDRRRERRRFWINTVLTAGSLLAAVVAAWAAVVVLSK